MASKQTANLGLSQWEPDDEILRADFNSDNAKLDGAVAALRTEKADKTVLNTLTQTVAQKADASAVTALAGQVTALQGQTAAISSDVLLADRTLTEATSAWHIDVTNIDFTQYRRMVLYAKLVAASDIQLSLYVNGGTRQNCVLIGSGNYIASYHAYLHATPQDGVDSDSLSRVEFHLHAPTLCFTYNSKYCRNAAGDLPVVSEQNGSSMDRFLTWSQLEQLDLISDSSYPLRPGSRVWLWGTR